MAIEAHSHEYEFVEEGSETADDVQAAESRAGRSLFEHLLLPRPAANDADSHFGGDPPEQPFRHNPLHDTEGVWWLAIRLTLLRSVMRGIELTVEEQRRERARYSFYDTFFRNIEARKHALMLPRTFSKGESLLHPLMRPLARKLEVVRASLVRAYRAAERDISSIDHQVAEKPLGAFISLLQDMVGFYEQEDVQLQVVRRPVAKKDTPEAPGAAILPGPSLDSQLQPKPKRRRTDRDLAREIDLIPLDLGAGAAKRSAGRLAKRLRHTSEAEPGASSTAAEAAAEKVMSETSEDAPKCRKEKAVRKKPSEKLATRRSQRLLKEK